MANAVLLMVSLVSVAILGIDPSEATSTPLSQTGKVKYEFTKLFLDIFDDYLGFFEGNMTISKKKHHILIARLY